MCSEDMDDVLKILDFAPRDLWLAYKEFSLGSFYKDEAAKVRFLFKVFSVFMVFRVFRLLMMYVFISCL